MWNEDERNKPNFAAARSTARTLIKQAGIVSRPIKLREAVDFLQSKHKGLQVYSVDLGGVDGIQIGEAIGYNPDRAVVRQRFTLAHELGHFLLGHNGLNASYETGRNWNSREEQEAKCFAGELLVPYELLKDDIKNKITNVKVLAGRYWVSEEAMWYRLKDCKLTSKVG